MSPGTVGSPPIRRLSGFSNLEAGWLGPIGTPNDVDEVMRLTSSGKRQWQDAFIVNEADFPMGLRRVGDWVLGQIVQDVPAEIGLCEFDCRSSDCSPAELEECERRQCRAKGELMPHGPRPHEPAARGLRDF